MSDAESERAYWLWLADALERGDTLSQYENAKIARILSDCKDIFPGLKAEHYLRATRLHMAAGAGTLDTQQRKAAVDIVRECVALIPMSKRGRPKHGVDEAVAAIAAANRKAGDSAWRGKILADERVYVRHAGGDSSLFEGDQNDGTQVEAFINSLPGEHKACALDPKRRDADERTIRNAANRMKKAAEYFVGVRRKK